MWGPLVFPSMCSDSRHLGETADLMQTGLLGASSQGGRGVSEEDKRS